MNYSDITSNVKNNWNYWFSRLAFGCLKVTSVLFFILAFLDLLLALCVGVWNGVVGSVLFFYSLICGFIQIIVGSLIYIYVLNAENLEKIKMLLQDKNGGEK